MKVSRLQLTNTRMRISSLDYFFNGERSTTEREALSADRAKQVVGESKSPLSDLSFARGVRLRPACCHLQFPSSPRPPVLTLAPSEVCPRHGEVPCPRSLGGRSRVHAPPGLAHQLARALLLHAALRKAQRDHHKSLERRFCGRCLFDGDAWCVCPRSLPTC